ncbi:DUF3987 domain-containing protein [Mesorhizobium sp. INR15]|uniref:DUF3987 domain-containing protein n=1 Tax=Mesorhizobium sp. INR15 TaxID=2654248 RepID=UPI0018965365|nr:DUF3987 domain-containing protein [Mesorhizobium sp. INR15]QPC93530.1 DUF3987 domain-containing protein [Mesorhizobium sp. INR15]
MTAPSANTCHYKVDDRVEHPELGHGTVIKVVGAGGHVRFDKHGKAGHGVAFAVMDYLSPSDAPVAAPIANNDNNPDPVDPWAEATSPSLPLGVLPPIIDAFARSRADQMGADAGGLAMAAMTVCAAAIPDSITLKVKRHETWQESARIWTVAVGEPSTRKSPIISAASAPLRKIEAILQADHRDAMRAWNALPKDTKKDTPQPIAKRVIAEDASTEKVAEILSNNEAGIALIDDELSGFFARMEKYAGAKGAGADRAFWLKSFGGVPYSVDRIGRGSIWVPNVSISLLGGIQPDPLRQIADSMSDDGLLQRIFPIMLAPTGEDRDEPASLDNAVYGKLVEDLYALRSRFLAGACLKFDDEAQAFRSDLAAEHREIERRWQSVNKRVATHVGKFDGLFARLALLIHLIENATGDLPREVSLDTAQRARTLLHDYLLPHAIALHVNVLGATDVHDLLTEAAGSILTNANLATEVSSRSLVRHGTRRIRQAASWEVDRVLGRLDGYAWIDPRPLIRNETTQHYNVNPRVHLKFAGQAATIAKERAAVRELIRGTLA